MLLTEYRIPMPFTLDEYQIGQLFMISRHSHEQSESGEGVEVLHNVPHSDKEHGAGRYTEKRIHLSSKLPYFIQALIPRVFYVTEKSWNYYPYTETEYTCSFLPRLNIFIKTRYEGNNGTTPNVLGLGEEELAKRSVDIVDIAEDAIQGKHYKASEDPKFYKSKKTGRGPLLKDWINNFQPIMTSYKLVSCSFEVWGLQTRLEEFAQKAIRETLLLGHRQAFAWLDDWYGMTEEEVRAYEQQIQAETNYKVLGESAEASADANEAEGDSEETVEDMSQKKTEDPSTGTGGLKSWLTWR